MKEIKFLQYNIDQTLKVADEFPLSNDSVGSIKKVLLLLRSEAQKNNFQQINQRVLRAMRDMGGLAAKSFEDTALEKALYDVLDILYKEVPGFESLKPLGMDFGKGDPV